MPAPYVKPYVKTNKSDYINAEAIAKAVPRPRMCFVPIRTEEQPDLQALHRVRERGAMRRTAVVNQIRSLLERGLTLPKGRSYVDQALPGISEDAELKFSGSFRVLLAQLKLKLEQRSARIEQMDAVIQKTQTAGLKRAGTCWAKEAKKINIPILQDRHAHASVFLVNCLPS